MSSCSAYNCSNKVGESADSITFHGFPQDDPELIKKWLMAMGKEKWTPKENDVICSFHFMDDQIVTQDGMRYLVDGAIPTKFEILASPKSLFPANWSSRMLSIRDLECNNRKGYVVEARIPINSREEFVKWLIAHQELAQVKYALLRSYPITSKNLRYKAEYVCNCADKSKNEKQCPARLIVRIRTDPKFRFTRPAEVVGYPCNVVLYHLHNHSIGSNLIEIKTILTEDVSNAVKQKFIEMFKGGYTVDMALEMHQKDLSEEYPDEYTEMLNDSHVCPSTEWLTNFHAKFVEEFEWTDSKIVDILKEEIEDINASKGSATMATLDENIILVLCTPLMQRAHSMKSSGEVVFVDNSGFLERCRCYVYVIMAYSCTEGLPLGLMITTADTEEVLTAGFRLLADILPEKGFGSFGRQGPEVFLTANNDALQNSLKAVYPDSAVLLCAYNMSHELWCWLWNPENAIEEADRCVLFSLAYKIMQTKNVEEFNELSNVIANDETVQKYENFKAHFEVVKSLSDRWAVCFKNEMLDKDKEISGIEMASQILKDKVFLTRAYNVLQLLKYYTDTMESYYRQKIINCINSTLETFVLNSFLPELRAISDLTVNTTPQGQYIVENIKKGTSYFVDMNISVCSCSLGLYGAKCKHLYAVSAKKVQFVSSVPSDDVIKKELFWIATGNMKSGTVESQMDADNEGDVDSPLPVKGSAQAADAGSHRNQKDEARKILERVMRNILQKYDSNPFEFHKAIVTAAVNYQNLNNDREVIAALRGFGKNLPK